MLNTQEARFLEMPRSLTRNAAFLQGQAWPRPSSPGQWLPWGQWATSLIQGCLKSFLEFNKDKRLCQHPRSPEQVRRLPGSSAWEGARDPGAVATMPTQPCDWGVVLFHSLGAASLLVRDSLGFRGLKRGGNRSLAFPRDSCLLGTWPR